ncbi:hypothetical protein [Streptomyces tubercidicus]|uniref:Uncharacterized protein n=1 Tax=Streptomyces tubercidicus TaxID=47759 RepID=A0A640ULY0_9ACTN|nr:hypothetical protein [Streptomyces tubercidicus]WAU11095.1 hypothetical protein STRTU_001267 [Streptomyces tubercidicus]GFE36312.1 hypothetical protein Stube_09850 [Streptomyces tubercidicus]
MCGACGDRTPADWARPLYAGPGARSALAAAALALAARPGLRVAARPGGWLVTGPTGAATACPTLTALVAALRRGSGPALPELPVARGSGALSVPAPDGRRGVRLRAVADAQAAAPEDRWTVRTDAEALAALGALAEPPGSLRHYLAGISGVTAPWGGSPRPVPGFDAPERASDLVVWAEWARQSGAFDADPFAATCPLDGTTRLDLEIRAGYVVRAVRLLRLPQSCARPAFLGGGLDGCRPSDAILRAI